MPAELALVSFSPASVLTSSCATGPGWFDSSFDLQRGLEVRESSAGDMRLMDWLDAFLRPQPSAAVR